MIPLSVLKLAFSFSFSLFFFGYNEAFNWTLDFGLWEGDVVALC